MLTGKGDTYWMTNSYQKDRNKALLDRSKFNDAQLALLDITDDTKGTGETDDDNFTVKQFPYPQDTSIRSRKDVDLREVDPRIGD